MRGPPVHTTWSRGPDAHTPSCKWHGFAVFQGKNLLWLVVKRHARTHVSLSTTWFDLARHQNTRHDAALHGTYVVNRLTAVLMRVLFGPEAFNDDWHRIDWPSSFFVFPNVTWDLCVVREEITRVSFPHKVEVSDVMEVTCSWAQFVHASCAAHALTKSMSICDKFSDDRNTTHMVTDSGVSLETFLRAVTKRSSCIWSPRQLLKLRARRRISTKKDQFLISRFLLPALRKGIRICCRAFCVAVNFCAEGRQRVLWCPGIRTSDQRPHSTFAVSPKEGRVSKLPTWRIRELQQKPVANFAH